MREPVTTMTGIALAFQNTLEPELIELTRSLVDRDSVIIDVGSNIGTYCLPLARCVKWIYAIDANVELVGRLRANANLNSINNLTAVCAAIDCDPGFRHFYLNRNRHDVSSMDRRWLGTRIAENRIEEEIVPALPLASLIDVIGNHRVAVIKIDVEGYSGAVIRSISTALSRVSAILAEDSADLAEVIPWLRGQGFSSEQPLRGLNQIAAHTATTWLFHRR